MRHHATTLGGRVGAKVELCGGRVVCCCCCCKDVDRREMRRLMRADADADVAKCR